MWVGGGWGGGDVCVYLGTCLCVFGYMSLVYMCLCVTDVFSLLCFLTHTHSLSLFYFHSPSLVFSRYSGALHDAGIVLHFATSPALSHVVITKPDRVAAGFIKMLDSHGDYTRDLVSQKKAELEKLEVVGSREPESSLLLCTVWCDDLSCFFFVFFSLYLFSLSLSRPIRVLFLFLAQGISVCDAYSSLPACHSCVPCACISPYLPSYLSSRVPSQRQSILSLSLFCFICVPS
jgi:hypothetical protein